MLDNRLTGSSHTLAVALSGWLGAWGYWWFDLGAVNTDCKQLRYPKLTPCNSQPRVGGKDLIVMLTDTNLYSIVKTLTFIDLRRRVWSR